MRSNDERKSSWLILSRKSQVSFIISLSMTVKLPTNTCKMELRSNDFCFSFCSNLNGYFALKTITMKKFHPINNDQINFFTTTKPTGQPSCLLGDHYPSFSSFSPVITHSKLTVRNTVNRLLQELPLIQPAGETPTNVSVREPLALELLYTSQLPTRNQTKSQLKDTTAHSNEPVDLRWSGNSEFSSSIQSHP